MNRTRFFKSSIFSRLNDWNIIKLNTKYLSNNEDDYMAFETSLKGFEAKISKMIISKMYDYIKIYDKNTHL